MDLRAGMKSSPLHAYNQRYKPPLLGTRSLRRAAQAQEESLLRKLCKLEHGSCYPFLGLRLFSSCAKCDFSSFHVCGNLPSNNCNSVTAVWMRPRPKNQSSLIQFFQGFFATLGTMAFPFASGPGSFLPTNMPARPACTWLWFLTSTSHSQQLGLHERYHSGVLLRRRLLRGTVVRCAASDETRCVVAPTWTNQGLAYLGQALGKVTYLASTQWKLQSNP